MMIHRKLLEILPQAFRVNPVVALLGPRQCGKSTLAKLYAETGHKENWFFDLENQRDVQRLENPDLTLGSLKGLIVIDEIQKRPELFPYLRTLVDRTNRKCRILVLGSASRDLLQQSSESLAGRISYLELTPFALQEIDNRNRLHLRGGFPLSYLAKSDSISEKWRQQYVSTFLERDLFDFGYKIPPATIRRFWMMLAHYHGQILNYSALARSFGISDMTARKYTELLHETFMIRLLQPWYENISKRQVKAPKLYFRDSGIFHTFLGVKSHQDLLTHPKLGASWEGFALEEVLRSKQSRNEECFFWSTHNESELDLLIFEKGKRIGYEFKFSDAPRLSPTMKVCIHDLKLDYLNIVVPQGASYPLAKNIEVIPFEKVIQARTNFRRAK